MESASEPTAEVVALYSLVVRHAGGWPHYGPANGEASAHVAVLFQPAAKKTAVLMTQGRYGASITNAAEDLLAFIEDATLAKLGGGAGKTAWIYRDSEGAWDEMVPVDGQVLNRHLLRFRPVGKRTLADALSRITAEGFNLDDRDKTCMGHFLRLST